MPLAAESAKDRGREAALEPTRAAACEICSGERMVDGRDRDRQTTGRVSVGGNDPRWPRGADIRYRACSGPSTDAERSGKYDCDDGGRHGRHRDRGKAGDEPVKMTPDPPCELAFVRQPNDGDLDLHRRVNRPALAIGERRHVNQVQYRAKGAR